MIAVKKSAFLWMQVSRTADVFPFALATRQVENPQFILSRNSSVDRTGANSSPRSPKKTSERSEAPFCPPSK